MCHSVVGFANFKYCNISGMLVQECSICWSGIVPESHFFDEVTNKGPVQTIFFSGFVS